MTLRGRFARARATGPETEGSNRPPKPKGGTTGKMRRAKPPNVIGRGPLLASPGLRVAIVCIVKDEVDYLEEWLAFHFALGVSHVFIYDNGSTDGSARLLERYQNHGLVTVVDWPLGGGQLAAYNHAVALDRPEVADLLRQALAAAVEVEGGTRGADVLRKAVLWQGFVAARNRYREIRGAEPQDRAAVEAALLGMRNAHTAWQNG